MSNAACKLIICGEVIAGYAAGFGEASGMITTNQDLALNITYVSGELTGAIASLCGLLNRRRDIGLKNKPGFEDQLVDILDRKETAFKAATTRLYMLPEGQSFDEQSARALCKSIEETVDLLGPFIAALH